MDAQICKTCGSPLIRVDNYSWRCPYCLNVYTNEKVKTEAEILKSLLSDFKIEQVGNLRRNLYDALNEKYTDSVEICRICSEIKKLLPEDFAANFFYTANNGTYKEVCEAIRNTNAEENREIIKKVVLHILKSLRSEYVLPLQNLVERAYKDFDLEMFEYLSTEISNEAEKILAGVYETEIPRDVFIAYSSKDMKKVEALVAFLEENGLECFVSARNLKQGRGAKQNYQIALREAMDNCKCVVFVSSKNSRTTECDALSIELKYIKNKDIINSPPEYRNNYSSIPEKYKKPRLEYRIDNEPTMFAAEKVLSAFFFGMQYALSPDEVLSRVLSLLDSIDLNKEEIKEKKKFCSVCGIENAYDVNFCVNCGSTAFLPSKEDFLKKKAEEERKLKEEKEIKRREALKKQLKDEEERNLEAKRAKKEKRTDKSFEKEDKRIEKSFEKLDKKTKKSYEKMDKRFERIEKRSNKKNNVGKSLKKAFYYPFRGLYIMFGSPVIPSILLASVILSCIFRGNEIVDSWRIVFLNMFSATPPTYIIFAAFLIVFFLILTVMSWYVRITDGRKSYYSFKNICPTCLISLIICTVVMILGFAITWQTLNNATKLKYNNGNMYKYVLVDDGYKLEATDLMKDTSAIIVPETIGGKKVVEIGEKAMYNDKCSVYMLYITENIERIGLYNYVLGSYEIEEIHLDDIGQLAKIKFYNYLSLDDKKIYVHKYEDGKFLVYEYKYVDYTFKQVGVTEK